MLYIHLVLCVSVLTFGPETFAASELSEELTTVENENINENEKLLPRLSKIYTLDENCDGNICTNFQFDNNATIAFFDIRENIYIKDDETYEVRGQLERENLVFKDSSFTHFPLHLFYSFAISELDMRNCSIESVTWESFLMADKLTILLLSQNKLKFIDESTFNYASELQYLFLDENEIHTLVDESFKGLNKLIYLDLTNNRLKQLPGLIFSSLPALRDIKLSGNLLYYLPNEIFARNQRLTTVTLNGNRLRSLDEYMFRNQADLILLDISHNERLGRLIMNLRTQFLVATNCSLYLVNLYGKVVNADLRDNRIVELYFAQPESLEKLVLRNNALQQIASLTRATNLKELDVADNPELEYLPDPWSVNSLERLDLSNTSLRILPISNLAEQTNLRMLNISNNKLHEINPQNFHYLEKLTHFYIDANDWNCFNLQLIMDLLIRPKMMVHNYDQIDPNFPGEYIDGIACMYRIEDYENGEDTEKNLHKPNAQFKMSTQTSAMNSFEMTNEYPSNSNTEEQKLRNEIASLRNELKAIVSFYETKFDIVFQKLDKLNERVAMFEHVNETMFQHMTIMT